MRAEDYSSRREEIHGWTINVASYKLGDCYYCTVDNIDPGARIARGEGASREEAERQAVEKATKYLASTRRFPVS